jgi:hypothetical protein
MNEQAGAQFEIRVDGKAHAYRDTRMVAMGAAYILKTLNRHSEVAVKDLRSGELTVVAYRRN